MMHGRKIRSIAALCAASLVAQPLIAVPPPPAPPPPPGATVVAFAPGPVALVPVTALSTAAIETQRGAIAQIMIELGEDEPRARQMAMELTADDLAVLLANPKMMQKAGDSTLIIGALIIVGLIVALVVLADSSTVVILT